MLMTPWWHLWCIFLFGASQCASLGAGEISAAPRAGSTRPAAPEPRTPLARLTTAAGDDAGGVAVFGC